MRIFVILDNEIDDDKHYDLIVLKLSSDATIFSNN